MKTRVNGTIREVDLPENVDGDFAEALLKDAKDWLLTPVELYAFDFKNTVSVQPSSYRGMLALSQHIRKSGKALVCFNLNKAVDKQIRQDGISDALNVIEDFANYAAKADKPKPPLLDVQFINPFLEATLMTLKKQAHTEAQANKPQLVNLDEKVSFGDIAIAGVISLNTEQFNGTITLAFPEVVFLKIYESMFGEKVDEINADIEDAAAELLNIIYGSAKTKINSQLGFQLEPSLPTILSGEKIKIRQRTYQKILVLPFDTAYGPFHVEISFDPKN